MTFVAGAGKHHYKYKVDRLFNFVNHNEVVEEEKEEKREEYEMHTSIEN